ncbi:MAG: SDR family NAD(P)-dependent oxidoreductase, partial [Ferruginibacter sp.]
MHKIALITGATAGIGKACAEKFAAGGYHLILTGRREERLKALKQQLQSSTTEVFTLCFDVQSRSNVFNAIENLPEKWKNIELLINNAGLALGRDSFENADID